VLRWALPLQWHCGGAAQIWPKEEEEQCQRAATDLRFCFCSSALLGSLSPVDLSGGKWRRQMEAVPWQWTGANWKLAIAQPPLSFSGQCLGRFEAPRIQFVVPFCICICKKREIQMREEQSRARKWRKSALAQRLFLLCAPFSIGPRWLRCARVRRSLNASRPASCPLAQLPS